MAMEHSLSYAALNSLRRDPSGHHHVDARGPAGVPWDPQRRSPTLSGIGRMKTLADGSRESVLPHTTLAG